MTKHTKPIDEGLVLEGAEKTVRLGDRSYTLREPVRSRARKLRRRYLELFERYEKAQKKADAALLLDVTDELLDMVFEFDDRVGGDQDYVEEHATESQIMLAARACWDLLNDPLVSMAARLGENTNGAAGGNPTETPTPEVGKADSSSD